MGRSRIRYRSTSSHSPTPESVPQVNSGQQKSKHGDKGKHGGIPPTVGNVLMYGGLAVALIAFGALGFGGQSSDLETLVEKHFPLNRVNRLTASVTPSPSPQTIYRQTYQAVVVIRTEDSQGSGVLINSQGVIVTNDHVVEEYQAVQVETAQGLKYTGIVRKRDSSNDLAIVEIANQLHLPSLPLNTEELEIGQTVYALGNPIGLNHSFTQGMISRLEANGDIQHSADLAPGSSGSPLLNENGEIIGVNKGIWKRFDDLGIATSSEAVQQLLEEAKDP